MFRFHGFNHIHYKIKSFYDVSSNLAEPLMGIEKTENHVRSLLLIKVHMLDPKNVEIAIKKLIYV